MSAPLICYSLRRRPDWAYLAPALLQGNTSPKWKEAKLDTHDVAIPLLGTGGQSQKVLRAILVSPSDVGTNECRTRIERLYHLNGGQDIVVVFLLKQETDQASPVAMLMKLQLDLVGELEISVVPVNSISAVPASLMAFHRQISTSGGPRKFTNPTQTLLRYCSDKPPLSEHAVHVLTDITSGFRGVLDAVSTPAGRMEMTEFLGDDSERTISFWAKEYLVE
ncbi:hypothetical protein AAE478_000944 [Parahypoxylon ruwenzoriense]